MGTFRGVQMGKGASEARFAFEGRIRIGGVELVPAVHVDRVEIPRKTKRYRDGSRYELVATPIDGYWALPGGGMISTRDLLARARRRGASLWAQLPDGYWIRKVRGKPGHPL